MTLLYYAKEFGFHSVRGRIPTLGWWKNMYLIFYMRKVKFLH
jgi:hypothetical protein